MSERHLTIRPHGEGCFAVFDGDELIATGTRAEVEEARERWQGQIDAGGEPDTFIGGLMIDEEARAETAALRTEFAKWCDEHSPEAYGREGWRQRRENNPQESEADRRRGEARECVLRAPSSVRNLPHPKIFKWLVGRWPSCPGRTTVMGILSDLRAEGLLPPSRRKRR